MKKCIREITSEYERISTSQMIEVDRLMIEEYHIELIQMMENAGRALAMVARERFCLGDPAEKKVAVLAGTGGNGGGALVCARRLHNWGARVEVFVSADEAKMSSVPAHQRRILKRMGVPIFAGRDLSESSKYDLLIDGLIGYNIKGTPYGVTAEMIIWANQRPEPVLALDTPSGLDLTSGKVKDPVIHADATLTLAMPKSGLFIKEAEAIIGELYLADISVPPQLYAEKSLGLRAQNISRYSDIVRIN